VRRPQRDGVHVQPGRAAVGPARAVGGHRRRRLPRGRPHARPQRHPRDRVAAGLRPARRLLHFPPLPSPAPPQTGVRRRMGWPRRLGHLDRAVRPGRQVLAGLADFQGHLLSSPDPVLRSAPLGPACTGEDARGDAGACYAAFSELQGVRAVGRAECASGAGYEGPYGQVRHVVGCGDGWGPEAGAEREAGGETGSGSCRVSRPAAPGWRGRLP